MEELILGLQHIGFLLTRIGIHDDDRPMSIATVWLRRTLRFTCRGLEDEGPGLKREAHIENININWK